MSTAQSNFTLQGRTGYVLSKNGTVSTSATVWTAFVAKDLDSSVIQVELTPDRTGVVVVFFP